MLLTIAVVLFIGGVFMWFYILESKKAPLPPGPIGIPIFGVLPFLNKPPHIKFQEYHKKYGKLCSFYMGTILVILLSDYEVIKEAFVKQGDNFSGRPRSFPFRVFNDDEGIITSDGYLFMQYKQFIMSTLKDFGALQKHFEIIVKENAVEFVKYLKTKANQCINILEPLGLSIAQSYCHIVLERKFNYEDTTFKKIIELSYREQRAYTNGIRIFLPWTRKIPFIKEFVGENDIRCIRNELYDIYGKIVDENARDYVEGSKDSFIHSWFTEDSKRKIVKSADAIFSRRNLMHNIDIILSAGYETTTTTLRWAFLCLLQNPHVQIKLIQELDEVIGPERPATLDDMKNLPYVCAVIHEVHRYATIAPLGLNHRNKHETLLDGFCIPPSSVVIPNIAAVHYNPHIFEDPFEFKPERFIDNEGKFCKSAFVIAFSLGKRQCPGEQLAQTEIFLYLTSIFQHFSIEKVNENDLLEASEIGSLAIVPMDYKMRFLARHEIRNP